MFETRIRAMREWYADFKSRSREHENFQRIFSGVEPSGVLTAPGEKMDPFEVGLIMVDRDRSMRRRLANNETILPEESRRVRKAGWLEAIDGYYQTEQTQEGFKVTVTIDTLDAFSYMSTYVADMAAFLEHGQDGNERYPATQNISLDGESFIYAFPQVQGAPERLRKFHIYTRPVDRSKIDPKFAKLSFVLQPPTPKTIVNP